MRRIPVELAERSYDIVVGTGVLGEAAAVLAPRSRVAVVSQKDVAVRWAGALTAPLTAAGVQVELFLMADGEEAKNLSTVGDLCRRFTAWGLLRGDAVVAHGGGGVGDTGGVAAPANHPGIASH
ncbi:MAG: 3-dehydroquinate synthase, partial [Acidimicrobiia bacterium]